MRQLFNILLLPFLVGFALSTGAQVWEGEGVLQWSDVGATLQWFSTLAAVVFCGLLIIITEAEKQSRYLQAKRLHDAKHVTLLDFFDMLLIMTRKSENAKKRFPRDLTTPVV